MKTILLTLLLSSPCYAGFCHRPCVPGWRYIEPAVCQPILEIDPCVKLVLDDIDGQSRGVGNVANQSRTGFTSGGMLGLLTSENSSSIGGGFGLGPGGFGGPGGGNGTTWQPEIPGSNNGSNGGIDQFGPGREIPEPSSLIVWLGLLFLARMLCR